MVSIWEEQMLPWYNMVHKLLPSASYCFMVYVSCHRHHYGLRVLMSQGGSQIIRVRLNQSSARVGTIQV